jgi:hypothetical protein
MVHNSGGFFRYEAEITRLRRELEARAGGAGPSGHPSNMPAAPTIGNGGAAGSSFAGGGIGNLPAVMPAPPGAAGGGSAALPGLTDREREKDYRFSKMDVDDKKPPCKQKCLRL